MSTLEYCNTLFNQQIGQFVVIKQINNSVFAFHDHVVLLLQLHQVNVLLFDNMSNVNWFKCTSVWSSSRQTSVSSSDISNCTRWQFSSPWCCGRADRSQSVGNGHSVQSCTTMHPAVYRNTCIYCPCPRCWTLLQCENQANHLHKTAVCICCTAISN